MAMFGPFERMVAGRYLRARRKEGFVSVIAGFSLLGIGLGVATLIIVLAVMNGFRQELLGRILGVNGHINVYANAVSLADYDALADQLEMIDGVVSVTPTVDGPVMATSGGRSYGVQVRGIDPLDLVERPLIADSLILGTVEDFATKDGVMIGSRLADQLRLNVGDSITLVSPRGNVTAFGTVPRFRAFPISAIFSIGMSEYDANFVYMPLNLAQDYFKYPDSVTALEIMVDNPDRDLRPLARQVADDVTGVRVFTWQQSNASFFNALQVERNVMFIILTLIILVAAFNIISGLIMLVKDKGADIAILRTMGASQGMIMRIFFIAGASVGVAGTILGLILGLLFCDNIEAIRQFLQSFLGADLFSAEIYFLSQIPAEVDWNETLSVVGMSLVLSFGATLYPAWRAAATDPVEALRYE